ncbi:hypothetical protein Ahy_A10g047915 [Arachis hypogaea]|uniref:Uncharacterized protein n=1 Tax=Arachis hypogaea TaxID=3818 RepID=A0A445B3S9_ARAHY|nr:hypothetical protein Ahy_A10g047915 [Arachis hypogaea]
MRTQEADSLSELKSLILTHFSGNERKEVGRVGYKMLAPMKNGVFQFCLFWLDGDEHVRLMFDVSGRIMAKQVMELSAEVCDVGGGGSGSSSLVQDDDPPLALLLLHCARPAVGMNVDGEESDKEYIVDSNESASSEKDDEDEFVPNTPVGGSVRYLLPALQPILELSDVPNHYHTLDLDAMHEVTLFSNMGADNYNTGDNVEFRAGHRFRSREAVMQGMKNYSIQRSIECQVMESDRLKEMRKFGGPSTCLATTTSQDHR